MPANNTTIVVENAAENSSLEAVPVVVKQGPPWLVSVYLNPPWWVNPLLQAIAVVAVIVVAYRLYQNDWRIAFDVQREMQYIAATVLLVMSGVLYMVNWFDQPYAVDATVGFLLGYSVTWLPRTPVWTFEWPDGLQDPALRNAVLWLLLGISAMVLPELAAANGQGMTLDTSRFILAGIAIVMALYDAAVLAE